MLYLSMKFSYTLDVGKDLRKILIVNWTMSSENGYWLLQYLELVIAENNAY